MAGWALVVTVPHRERAVARMLAAFDVPYHLFCELRQRVCRGRIITRAYPVFPGYIFVQLVGLLWERVRTISNVLGYVKLGQNVDLVEDRVVQQLVAASTEDVLPLVTAPIVSRFKPGDRVVVHGEGVLAGQTAVFQRMLVGTQALIDVEWFGRWVPIAVDERDLDLNVTRRRRRRRRREESSICEGIAA